MNVGAVVSGIATIAWIVVIVVIGLTVMRATRGQSFRGAIGLIIGSIAVALIATVISAAIIFVQPTDRGVVISALDEGIRPVELQPGLNFVVPFLENVLHYPIERQRGCRTGLIEHDCVLTRHPVVDHPRGPQLRVWERLRPVIEADPQDKLLERQPAVLHLFADNARLSAPVIGRVRISRIGESNTTKTNVELSGRG